MYKKKIINCIKISVCGLLFFFTLPSLLKLGKWLLCNCQLFFRKNSGISQPRPRTWKRKNTTEIAFYTLSFWSNSAPTIRISRILWTVKVKKKNSVVPASQTYEYDAAPTWIAYGLTKEVGIYYEIPLGEHATSYTSPLSTPRLRKKKVFCSFYPFTNITQSSAPFTLLNLIIVGQTCHVWKAWVCVCNRKLT